jgi:hypothetical protein
MMNKYFKLTSIVATLILTPVTLANAFDFGDDWKVQNPPTCSYKKNGKTVSGIYYKHAGLDIMAKAGRAVIVKDHINFVETHWMGSE